MDPAGVRNAGRRARPVRQRESRDGIRWCAWIGVWVAGVALVAWILAAPRSRNVPKQRPFDQASQLVIHRTVVPVSSDRGGQPAVLTVTPDSPEPGLTPVRVKSGVSPMAGGWLTP